MLVLYLLYVGSVFAALHCGALGRFTRDAEDFKLEASGGHSFWPGRFVLHDVRLRFKDYNIELAIEAREVFFRFSLFPILSKTIHIDEFVARDARYRMLHRVKDGERNRERLAAFPDIGFERPKVYDSPRPPYQVPPYRIRVDSIRANVLEVWILEYRALGNFQATGGFEVDENVTVLPSHTDLHDAQLFLGRRLLSRDVDCDLSARLGPFPGNGKLHEVVGKTNAQIHCHIPLEDLSALEAYWPDSSFELAGTGAVDADLRLVSGQLQSSLASFAMELDQVGLSGAFLSGTLGFDGRVDDTGHATGSGTFRANDRAGGAVEVEDVGFTFALVQPKVWRPTLEAASVQIRDANVFDPRLLRQLTSESAPPLKLENTDVGFEYATDGTDTRDVRLTTRGALALFTKDNGSLACAFRSATHCTLSGGRLSCPGSELSCAPLIASTENRSASVKASLRANKLEVEHGSLSSEWTITFDDPTKILQLTVAKDMWTKLGLELASFGDVAGRIRVNHRESTSAGTIDELRSGPFVANAGFMLADHFVSRWRIETPLGRFGVEQDLEETTVTPFVGNEWDILDFGP